MEYRQYRHGIYRKSRCGILQDCSGFQQLGQHVRIFLKVSKDGQATATPDGSRRTQNLTTGMWSCYDHVLMWLQCDRHGCNIVRGCRFSEPGTFPNTTTERNAKCQNVNRRNRPEPNRPNHGHGVGSHRLTMRSRLPARSRWTRLPMRWRPPMRTTALPT